MQDETNIPVIPRDPADLPPELTRGAEIPNDLDPLAEGVLMKHQRAWVEDQSDLKLCEKGRRSGITFAEALDDTLIAAAARSAGGDNVFYIGDTKDKGREFIGYVAHFARTVAKETAHIEEYLFEDQREDGTSKHISAFRVAFASGYRVEALSSRPENIRGLQGVVVIDEAGHHQNVNEVIDAVNALLIWGGKVRVIGTHNGLLNPFNELIREAKAGKNNFSLHFCPFGVAVANGLYERVCLVKGWTVTPEGKAAWEAKIRGSYGTRTAQMRQELDAIPADAIGSALSRVVIERQTRQGIPVLRHSLPSEFVDAPMPVRQAMTAEWCRTVLRPVLDGLDSKRRHDLGWDFARTGDGSVPIVTELGQDLVRRQKLVIELRNVPYETQRDIGFFLIEALPRFGHAAFDASGNGAYLAEVCAQKFGAERISQIKLSQEWYRENGTAYVEAFGDQTIEIAADEDIVRDHQALQYVNGAVMVPQDMRYAGNDGFMRHGDAGIAGQLVWYASRQDAAEYGYQPVTAQSGSGRDNWLSDGGNDLGETVRGPDEWVGRSPLGAHLGSGGWL